jgi:phosphoglycerol transferase MdoB-like AlkP superfamily enzyme
MFLIQRHMHLFKRFLFLLAPYSLLRVGFYFYHLSIYKHFNQNDIFESLILGLRFDVAAICLLNIPSILLALIPSKNSKFLFFERVIFVVINTAGFIASLDDYELFSFMGKRLSFDLFVITDDIWEQLPQLVLNFWYFPLIGLIFGLFFYFFDRAFFSIKKKKAQGVWLQILSSFFLVALSFVGIRGGLQHKSINVQSAFSQGRNELGHLVLNTPYHFLRTLKNQSEKKLTYFKSDDEAINIIMNRRDLRSQNLIESKKNIVFIIVESFSLEYVEKGYTPFLSELIKSSRYFTRHIANGRRSIEALPSLLCGLPALLDEPISKSIFQSNKFTCMPKILKSHGYKNYFFHGGAKGTMGFESYTLASGFDRYFSREDYPNKDDYDGTWGIFDGPFLDYSATEIRKMEEPFLASLFTLSSHQPYSVPVALKGKFPKGTLDIHESIGYADNSLKLFFEKIKNEPWFLNTVFFITSDHTSKLESHKFQNLVGHYRVPFLIYDPNAPVGENIAKVTQHSDIPKMMLNYVGINGEDLPATSVGLKDDDQGYALNYADGREYWMATKDEVVRLSKDQTQKLYNYDWETGALSAVGPSEDPLLKAYMQYYINGLINNNLSIYR